MCFNISNCPRNLSADRAAMRFRLEMKRYILFAIKDGLMVNGNWVARKFMVAYWVGSEMTWRFLWSKFVKEV